MNIKVYATRVEQDKNGRPDEVAVLGFPVSWSLEETENSMEVVLAVADNSKIWQDDAGTVWIDEGNNAGFLCTYNKMPTLTIHTYYGNVNKWLRIMSINRNGNDK